jgi:transcriptional regulator with XRE-family HTH domain
MSNEHETGSGMRLRLARQARGYSQQQLAGMADVTRQAVSAVESGLSDPSLRVALALTHALGMTVEDLFGPPDDPEFRAALVGYLEWGTRLAMHNSQPGAEVVQRAPVPRWGWGVAPPYQS